MDPTKENQPTVNLCGSSGTVDDAPAQLSQQVTCSSSSVISSSPSPSSSSLSSQRQLRSEALRLDIFPEATFQEWLCFLTPRELAASGFFFCGSANQARCTFCHITVVQGGWCRHSPNCPFVKDLRGVEVCRKLQEKFSRMKSDMVNLLIEAAGEGDFHLVRELLNNYNVPVDAARKSDGVTALHLACRNGHLKIVQWLIEEKKAVIEKADSSGRRAIYFAVKGRQPEILNLLISKGAELDVVTSRKRRTALHKAVLLQNVVYTKILIANMCDVNMQDSDGNTAAHIAVKRSVIKTKFHDGSLNDVALFCDPFDVLMNCHRVDHTIRNSKGLDVFPAAVEAGNLRAAGHFLLKGSSESSGDPLNEKEAKSAKRIVINFIISTREVSTIERDVQYAALERFLFLFFPSDQQEKGEIKKELLDNFPGTMQKFPFLSFLCYVYAVDGDGGFIEAVKSSLRDRSVNELLDYYVQTYNADDGPCANNKRSFEVVKLPTDSKENATPSKVPRLITNDD